MVVLYAQCVFEPRNDPEIMKNICHLETQFALLLWVLFEKQNLNNSHNATPLTGFENLLQGCLKIPFCTLEIRNHRFMVAKLRKMFP